MDSVEDTIESSRIISTHYIDIEDLKAQPRLKLSDFPSRKEALEYANARLDSLNEKIRELESDMVFLSENPTQEEVKLTANKWLVIAQEASE